MSDSIYLRTIDRQYFIFKASEKLSRLKIIRLERDFTFTKRVTN